MDLGGLAELDVARGEKLTYRLGDDETPPSADGECGLAIEIAHGAQPIPVRARVVDTHAKILVECSTIMLCCQR